MAVERAGESAALIRGSEVQGETWRPPATASVIITTRNRKEELRSSLQSVLSQTTPVEIIVIDDGSIDGTAAMVRAEFPGVRVVRHMASAGYIVRRNEGSQLAIGDVIVSIDDDAVFPSPETIGQTLREFNYSVIGAVAIPFIDINGDNRLHQRAPDTRAVYVTDAYIGTAHAVRRDVFLGLGGYREHLVHQGEEGDFCIRMLAAGYVVRVGAADPIHHCESPKRDLSRMDFYGSRNAVLFAWQNVPSPLVLAHLPMTTMHCLLHTLEPRRLKDRLSGLIEGYRQCCIQPRRPVSRAAYRYGRVLKTTGPKPIARTGMAV